MPGCSNNFVQLPGPFLWACMEPSWSEVEVVHRSSAATNHTEVIIALCCSSPLYSAPDGMGLPRNASTAINKNRAKAFHPHIPLTVRELRNNHRWRSLRLFSPDTHSYISLRPSRALLLSPPEGTVIRWICSSVGSFVGSFVHHDARCDFSIEK